MSTSESQKKLPHTVTPAANGGAGVLELGNGKKLSSDSGQAARVGLWTLALGFGGFLLWAALAPLDEGVPAQGTVMIDTKRKPIQHLTGGIVKEVLVHEGQEVKAGEVLLRLDDAAMQSNFQATRQRYLSLRAMHGRLEAENRGLSTIEFHPDLVAASQDILIQQQVVTQRQLFESRRSGLRAELQSMEENVKGQQSMLAAYENMLTSRRAQLALIEEELANTRALVNDGYAPRNRLLELQRAVSDANTMQSELRGNIARTKHSIAEVQQRITGRQREYRKEVDTQLADVSREVLAEEARVRAVSDDRGRTEIKTPVSGQVVGLAFQASGSVLQGGQKVMDIVPENEVLMLEVKVQAHLIDNVKEGLPVDVRFSSFAHSPQLVLDGTVRSVSSDLLIEQGTNVVYYLARVSLTPEGVKTLGKRKMQPGMPVEVVFKTGERSLLTYLLHPLTKRLAASMKEE